MIVIFPIASDASLRHWPIATGVTMGVLVLVSILQIAIPELTETWLLQYGVPNPLTWFTSAYLHGGVGHLIGNLLFLFVFGLIVEGKIGWWRFLIVYNVCAVASGFLISGVTIFMGEGGCLGASCAIFGLMLIAFIWAPENEVTFKVAGVIFYRPFTFTFDASMQHLCLFFVGLNLVIAGFSGFAISSEVLHLLGTIPGIAIAVGMLKLRRVNCDGHDLISIMSNKRGQSQLTVEEKAVVDQERERRISERKEKYQEGREMVDFYVREGHYEMAVKRFDSLRSLKKGLVMEEALLVQLINGTEKDASKTELYRGLLLRYLRHYDRLENAVTLKLVKLILDSETAPRQALKVLAKMDQSKLKPAESKVFRALAMRAKQQVTDGVIEVRTDEYDIGKSS